jgi:hypothetical protein
MRRVGFYVDQAAADARHDTELLRLALKWRGPTMQARHRIALIAALPAQRRSRSARSTGLCKKL